MGIPGIKGDTAGLQIPGMQQGTGEGGIRIRGESKGLPAAAGGGRGSGPGMQISGMVGTAKAGIKSPQIPAETGVSIKSKNGNVKINAGGVSVSAKEGNVKAGIPGWMIALFIIVPILGIVLAIWFWGNVFKTVGKFA